VVSELLRLDVEVHRSPAVGAVWSPARSLASALPAGGGRLLSPLQLLEPDLDGRRVVAARGEDEELLVGDDRRLVVAVAVGDLGELVGPARVARGGGGQLLVRVDHSADRRLIL